MSSISSPIPGDTSPDKGLPGAQGPWAKLVHKVSGTHVLALADQAIVSGTSFLSTVVIARSGDPGELGIYAVGISILTILLSVQDSVILTPYSIQLHQPLGSREEHAGSSLAISALLSGSALLLFFMVAALLNVLAIPPRIAAMIWMLGSVVPFVLLREFGRRYAFAHLRIAHAVLQDVIVSALQLGALAWLFSSGHLSAVTATLALGAACLLTSIGWFLTARGQLSFRLDGLRENLERSWSLGKWLLGGRLSVNIQGYLSYWMTMLLFGAASTGAYAVCMSIVSFANPLIFGLGNVLTPQSAVAWKQGGVPALWRFAIKEAWLFTAVVGAFCLLVVLGGDQMMQAVYPGPEFSGYGHALVVLSLAMLALAVSFPAVSALATMQRPRAILVTAVIASVSTLVLVAVLMTRWGVTGAAYGYLAGNLILAVGRWAAVSRIVAASVDPLPDTSLFTDLTQSDPQLDVTIARLGEGDYAVAFMVTAPENKRLSADHSRLVVKLFSTAAGLDIAAAERQFEALSRLHNSIDGFVAKDWTFSVPAPVHFSRSPIAIVMTAVDGRPFDEMDPGTQKLDEAALALAAAMQQSWVGNQVHGDLGFQNMLFDFEGRRIALIDPGTVESCPPCCSGAIAGQAAALELGHLLADLTRDVVHRLGTPAGRRRRQYFIQKLVIAAMADIRSLDGQREFLRDMELSVESHLEDLATQASGVKHLWHRLVMPLKLRCGHGVLEKIAADAGAPGLPDRRPPVSPIAM